MVMDLLSSAADSDEIDRDDPSPPAAAHHLDQAQFPVRTRAYRFDGRGNYCTTGWDLAAAADGAQFCWYHVELPKTNHKLAASAQSLITVLCPPLNLQDILTLASNGPFCRHVGGALIFRVNSSAPALSDFALRIAARVTGDSVITVSLGRVPRLGFSPTGQSLLSEIPRVDSPAAAAAAAGSGVVIGEDLLESLLAVNHSEEAEHPVPKRVADLLLHVVDTHVDQVQDIVTKLETELNSIEVELDRGGPPLKKQMLDDGKFAKMHLNLQRLLQIVADGEQVFPRVKEKCAANGWFVGEDMVAFEELIACLRRLKEKLGLMVNRAIAVQTGLDSWQSEQINRKLYYLSFLSMIFPPLSIVTGVKFSLSLYTTIC